MVRRKEAGLGKGVSINGAIISTGAFAKDHKGASTAQLPVNENTSGALAAIGRGFQARWDMGDPRVLDFAGTTTLETLEADAAELELPLSAVLDMRRILTSAMRDIDVYGSLRTPAQFAVRNELVAAGLPSNVSTIASGPDGVEVRIADSIIRVTLDERDRLQFEPQVGFDRAVLSLDPEALADESHMALHHVTAQAVDHHAANLSISARASKLDRRHGRFTAAQFVNRGHESDYAITFEDGNGVEASATVNARQPDDAARASVIDQLVKGGVTPDHAQFLSKHVLESARIAQARSDGHPALDGKFEDWREGRIKSSLHADEIKQEIENGMRIGRSKPQTPPNVSTRFISFNGTGVVTADFVHDSTVYQCLVSSDGAVTLGVDPGPGRPSPADAPIGSPERKVHDQIAAYFEKKTPELRALAEAASEGVGVREMDYH